MLRGYLLQLLKKKPKKTENKGSGFESCMNELVGYKIKNIQIFREAFSVKTSQKERKHFNYERLEFLGDAILGSIISSYLYELYPDAKEGFLTQMKSKIVNRKNLNEQGEKLQLKKYIINNDTNISLGENISGNLFEALVGAIFLDLDYQRCQEVIIQNLLTKEDITKLENKIISYKGLLLEWGQKQKCNMRFETTEQESPHKTVSFKCCIWVDDKRISNASELSKKKAEEKAAQRAYYSLYKKENLNAKKQKNISGF